MLLSSFSTDSFTSFSCKKWARYGKVGLHVQHILMITTLSFEIIKTDNLFQLGLNCV